DNRALEHTLRERESQVARIEKLLAAALADKTQAARRIDEQARRADRGKPEIEQLRAELEAEKQRRAASDDEHARAMAQAEQCWQQERVEAQRAAAEVLAREERAHADTR